MFLREDRATKSEHTYVSHCCRSFFWFAGLHSKQFLRPAPLL